LLRRPCSERGRPNGGALQREYASAEAAAQSLPRDRRQSARSATPVTHRSHLRLMMLLGATTVDVRPKWTIDLLESALDGTWRWPRLGGAVEVDHRQVPSAEVRRSEPGRLRGRVWREPLLTHASLARRKELKKESEKKKQLRGKAEKATAKAKAKGSVKDFDEIMSMTGMYFGSCEHELEL
jgi:hypothetical protein